MLTKEEIAIEIFKTISGHLKLNQADDPGKDAVKCFNAILAGLEIPGPTPDQKR